MKIKNLNHIDQLKVGGLYHFNSVYTESGIVKRDFKFVILEFLDESYFGYSKSHKVVKALVLEGLKQEIKKSLNFFDQNIFYISELEDELDDEI